MSVEGDFVLGKVGVTTTDGKGHDPEFWATQATKKICDVSANAPEHIKQQALAFQNQVYTVISVSYTHLRAHETDSYLVCRLLL